MGKAVGHVEPDFTVVGLVAEGLLIVRLPGPDCYIVFESDDWNGEGRGVWRGDGRV